MGHRRRRGDVRHRLPGAVADGRLGHGHQGVRARHAGLLEHRRPGVDGVVRRARSPKLSAFGDAEHGRPEAARSSAGSCMAHGNAYVAQTTPAHLNHFYRSVMEANAYPGPAIVIAYTACMPEHGIADDAASRQAKLAVDSRAFPLFTYDPRRGSTFAERLSLQGNPALRADWATLPSGEAGRLPVVRTLRGPFRRRISAAMPSRHPRSRPRRPIASPTGEPSRNSPVSDRPWVRDVPHACRGDRRHRGSGSRRPSGRHGFVEPARWPRRRFASVTA